MIIISVPLYWSSLITRMIVNDEGGWELTEDKNDPGGLTFGGMTYRTFVDWAKTQGEHPSVEGFKLAAHNDDPILRQQIIQCYHDLYVIPFGVAGNYAGDMLVSAAVNVGIKQAIVIMQRAANCNPNLDKLLAVDGIVGPKTRDAWMKAYEYFGYLGLRREFCNIWRKFYVDLVQENAKAWVKYARLLETYIANPTIIDRKNLEKEKPKFVRSEYLEGWINRVQRYVA